MTGLVRKATLFAACGLLVAATAFANVPSPGNSTVPTIVPVVGTEAGVPHLGQSVTVTINDFLNNPIENSVVVFDFSAMPDVALCTAVVAGTGTVNCGASTVQVITDLNGQATIWILGEAKNGPPAGGTTQPSKEPFHGLNDGVIYADGINMGTFHAPCVMQDEDNDIQGDDSSRVLKDKDTFVAQAKFFGRSDWRNDGAEFGTLNGNDPGSHLARKDESAAGLGSRSGCHDGTSVQPYCF